MSDIERGRGKVYPDLGVADAAGMAVKASLAAKLSLIHI